MAGAISVQIQGADELKADLNRIDRRLRKQAAKEMVEAGGYVIQNHARLNIHETFSKHQTGGLSNSLTVRAENQGNGAVATISTDKVYGRIQEFGGTIVPINGPFLIWRDPDTGELCKARSVTLPPRPYLEPAAMENQEEIVKAMRGAAAPYIRK